MVADPKSFFTQQEYLELENEAETKSEFINGQIYAMSGGSTNHSRVTGRIHSMLDQHLRGKPCEPFNSDLRLRVLETNSTFYPDAMVACPPLEYAPEDRYALTNPVVLIEVLSPSTPAFDRGAKFQHYRHISSLRDYLIIEQDSMRIEHFARQDDDAWLLREYSTPGDVVELTSIACRLNLSEVYERVEFPE